MNKLAKKEFLIREHSRSDVQLCNWLIARECAKSEEFIELTEYLLKSKIDEVLRHKASVRMNAVFNHIALKTETNGNSIKNRKLYSVSHINKKGIRCWWSIRVNLGLCSPIIKLFKIWNAKRLLRKYDM